MKRPLSVFVIMCMCLMIIPISGVGTLGANGIDPPVKVYVSPSVGGGGLSIGSTYTVNVMVENVQDLYGWQFSLAFNPDVLEAQSVTEGEFLKRGGKTTFFIPGTINNTAGTINAVAASRLGNVLGETGSGILFSVTFKVIANGVSDIAIASSQLLDSATPSQSILHTAEDGMFDNTAPTVTSTTPTDLATNVPITSNVSAIFSEDMDESTLNLSTFILKDALNTSVLGAVNYNALTKTVTFDPTFDLAYSTTYTATLTTGAEDLAGNNLATDKVWTLTTAAAPDTTPPTTELTTNPPAPDGENNWFKTIPSITLTPDEEATTYYSWVSDTGPWTEYTSSFNALTGENTLYYYSVDTSTNTETVKSKSFKVDNAAPSSNITAPTEGAYLKGTNYIIEGVSSDPSSSEVAKVEVSINDGSWQLATGTTSWSYNWSLPSDGIYNIKSKATDNAGNTETPQAGVNITVDNTAPAVNAGADIEVEQETHAGTEVTLQGSCSDIVDPNPVCEWYEGTTKLGDGPNLTHTFNLGEHILTLKCTDACGNMSQDTVKVTVVDSTKPQVNAGPDKTVLVDPPETEANVTLVGTATDNCDPDLSYLWTEEDINLGTSATLTHIFGLGKHTVILKVTDESGNIGEDTVIVEVKQKSVSPQGDFSIECDPTTLNIQQGKTGSTEIDLTSIDGFGSVVNLSVWGLPSGVSYNFNPSNTVIPTGTASLEIKVSDTASCGSYLVLISAVGGGKYHYCYLNIKITPPPVDPATQPDFTISSSPSGQTVCAGDSTSFNINLTSINGFASPVNLKVYGLPNGSTYSFSVNPVVPDGECVLTINTSSSDRCGTYLALVSAVGGGKVHFAYVNIRIIPQS